MSPVVALDEDREQRAERVRVDGLAPAGGEHVVAAASPLRADLELVGGLRLVLVARRTVMVPSSRLTMRFLPLLVVPSMRAPSMNDAEPLMTSYFASRSMSDHRRWSSSPRRALV
jgi:hypothetical protein